MQPLVSPVDHESRHNSYRAQDGEETAPVESTPLLHRFPAGAQPRRLPATTAVVGLLLLVLVTGVIIGIYLLVVQNSSGIKLGARASINCRLEHFIEVFIVCNVKFSWIPTYQVVPVANIHE